MGLNRRKPCDSRLFRICPYYNIRIAVGRLAQGNAIAAAQLVGRTHLAADVARVPLVHDVAERGKIVVALLTIHAVVYGDEADVVFREIGVGVKAHLQIVATEPGHILDDHRVDEPGLNILQHLLEAGAVEIGAGIAIIPIVADIAHALPFGVLGKQIFLVEDAFSKRSLGKQQKAAKIKGLRRCGLQILNCTL